MTTATAQQTIPVEFLQLSPRVRLQAGDRFHVKRGSGPVWCNGAAGPVAFGAPWGEYELVALFRPVSESRKLFAEAVHVATGATHVLRLAGPVCRSEVLDSVEDRPYAVRRLRKAKPR